MFSLNFPQREVFGKSARGGGWRGLDAKAFFPPLTGCGIVCGENEASDTR